MKRRRKRRRRCNKGRAVTLSTAALLLLLSASALPSTAIAFEDRDNCGLFDPEPQQEQMARLQVDDRIVNGYKV